MWLVTGIDEEHRFPDWVAAAAFYRQIVEDWVARNGGPDRCGDQARRVHDLPPGGSQEVELTAAGGRGETVRFALSWDIGGGRTDHFVAC
jgi:hypothetical protein